MAVSLRVLMVESSPADARLVRCTLEDAGYTIMASRVKTAEGYACALECGTWDVILSEWTLPRFSGVAALDALKAASLDIPFLLVSGTTVEDAPIAGMRAGAQDFISKKQLGRLVPAIARELANARLRREHDHALAALRESEATLLSFYEHAPLMMGVVELVEGDILHVYDNPATARFFGREPGSTEGYLASEIGAPAAPVTEWRRRYAEAEQRGGGVTFTYLHEDDTRSVWLQSTVAPIGIGPSGRSRFCYVAEDVTARRRAEIERDRALQDLKTIVDTSPLSIIAVDSQLNVQLWSRAAEHTFGWRADEVLGKPYPLVPAQLRDESAHLFDAAFHGDNAVAMIVRRLRRDGQEVEVQLWNTQLRDGDGQVVGLLGIMADMTPQRHLEQQLRQASKLEAIGRLAGGIAHDFNNMLTAIMGHVEFIAAEVPEGAPVRENVVAIRKGAEHAAALTRQLLTFSRRDATSARPIDLGATVRATKHLLARVIGEDIHLQMRTGDGLWAVKADPVQIEQVILNLSINARDAMPSGGVLAIEVSNIDDAADEVPPMTGPAVRLSVRDTGTGMTQRVKEHLFEPFFTTKPPESGTGLGLATVYGIVQQLGGQIRVDSQLGRGSVFRIYLPREEAPVVNDAANAHGARAQVKHNGTVLLVEDEEPVRKLVRRVLERAGYRVLEAHNGIEALLLSKQERDRLCLLLTDAVMPGMGGHELVQHMRRSQPHLPCILMSGYTESDEPCDASVHFLPKPFMPAALLSCIENVLAAASTA